MEPNTLSQLLKLPASDRAELAMALWDSLSDSEREGALELPEEHVPYYFYSRPSLRAPCANPQAIGRDRVTCRS